MPVWLPYIGTIVGALVQLTKLLIDLAKDKKSDQIKQCGIAIEDARKTGDTAKLISLLERMKRGDSCD